MNCLIQDLYELVKQAVDLTVKTETHGFTDSLVNAFNRMKAEMEKQFAQFQELYKTEMGIVETDVRRALKTMRNEIIEDRLRVEKKMAAAKQSLEGLVAKVKSVEDVQQQSNVLEIRSSNCIGVLN